MPKQLDSGLTIFNYHAKEISSSFNLSVYRRNNPRRMLESTRKDYRCTRLWLVINKLFLCSPNIPRGLLCRKTDRTRSLLLLLTE